ncbi:MAG: PAS domain S-box protein [Nitrospirota bacterium]|nr:PAS domain S-box protein [Nitrospirota bacterium]MDP2383950.1 PAS domain S-box protein [Nitrospirota bacterium]
MDAPFPPPIREAARLAALYRYEMLDTSPVKELDDLVHLAAYICNTPIALISLIDSDRQWFKSKIGLTATETSRIIAFCAHTILGTDLLIVPDALADERFMNNPLVTGDLHIRFYCGAPLVTPEGFRIGTLSVIDHVPRELSDEQRDALGVLSRQVMDHLTLDREHRELILAVNEQKRGAQALEASEAKFKQLSETTSSAIYIYRGSHVLYANPAATTISGYSLAELHAMSLWDLIHPDFQDALMARVGAVQGGVDAPARLEFQIVRKDGQVRWLDFTAASIDFDGQQARIGTAYDITERKQAEELNAVQRRFLESVLMQRPLAETMQSLVRSIEALSTGGVCSILLVQPETGTLHRGVVSTLPEEFNRAVDGAPIGPCHGSCGTAAYRKATVIVSDIATDPLWNPWPEVRDLALRHGLHACTSLPMLNAQGDVLGTYAMYFLQARGPTAFELDMLGAASQAISIAIEWGRTEEELRTSEARLAAILDNSPLVIFLKDLDGRYLFINRTFERRFDLSHDQIIGKTDDDLFSPEQATAFRSNDREVLRTGQSIEFEEVAQYRDGEHTSLVVKFPLRDAKEGIYAICGIVADITERKRAEEALRHNEERFRLVALATNDVLWDWNLITKEHWWSPDACIKFGYDPKAEPDIKAWTDRLHPDDRAAILKSLDEVVAGQKEMWSGEYRFRLADGGYGHFLDRGHVVRETTGKPVRMIGAMTDVTGAKQAYTSLNDAYARLQVMSREVQVAEEKERRRLSRELHDEFGQLLSALMFDLSDIGRGVQQLRSPLASELRKKIKLAMGTLDRLFVSFREVLAALRPAVLDVLGLVPAIEALAGELQERTGVRCSIVAEREDLGQVCGPDISGAIYRMAQELLMNVVRHAEATTAVITLDCTDKWAMLVVEDNGVGFSAQLVPPNSVFGLRGIQERAELLAGNVEIQSKPGNGTVVTVRLPCGAAAASRRSVAGVRKTKPPTIRKKGRHGKAL